MTVQVIKPKNPAWVLVYLEKGDGSGGFFNSFKKSMDEAEGNTFIDGVRVVSSHMYRRQSRQDGTRRPRDVGSSYGWEVALLEADDDKAFTIEMIAEVVEATKVKAKASSKYDTKFNDFDANQHVLDLPLALDHFVMDYCIVDLLQDDYKDFVEETNATYFSILNDDEEYFFSALGGRYSDHAVRLGWPKNTSVKIESVDSPIPNNNV